MCQLLVGRSQFFRNETSGNSDDAASLGRRREARKHTSFTPTGVREGGERKPGSQAEENKARLLEPKWHELPSSLALKGFNG